MPYYVYILASRSRVLYVGVTNDLDVLDAIAREKQVKSWTRAKREALIAVANPEWDDLLPRPDPSLRSG